MHDFTENNIKAIGQYINEGDARLAESLAPLYNASSTYAVNDLCIYAGRLYKCTTAIATAEAWTAAHWAATSLSAELASQVTAAINGSY